MTFGGNGVATFALPDLRGRVPLGSGNGPGLTARVQGQAGGSETTALLVANLPSHSHTVLAYGGSPSAPTRTPGATTSLASTLRNAAPVYATGTPAVTMGASSLASVGSGVPVSNLQPTLCISFIIATEGGVFPV